MNDQSSFFFAPMKTHKYFKAFLSICILATIGNAQGLSPEERRLVEHIDANMPAAISFLEKTVNVSSPTEDIASVRQVGSLYAREFEALGMAVKWIDMPPDT